MDAGTERLFRPPPSALKRCCEKALKVRAEGGFSSLSGFSAAAAGKAWGTARQRARGTALVRAAPLRSAPPASSPPCMQIWRRGGSAQLIPGDWAAALSPLPAAVASDILPAGAAAAKRRAPGGGDG